MIKKIKQYFLKSTNCPPPPCETILPRGRASSAVLDKSWYLYTGFSPIF